jgi:hypothetical protein
LVEVSFGLMASQGKQLHIERALKVANDRLLSSFDPEGAGALPRLIAPPSGALREPFSRVILLDDDPRNIDHALRSGHEGIFVDPPGQGGDEHLDKLAQLLELDA